jgi:hypothetical protein
MELFFWNISLPFLNLTFLGKYLYQGTQYNKFSSSLFCSFDKGNSQVLYCSGCKKERTVAKECSCICQFCSFDCSPVVELSPNRDL